MTTATTPGPYLEVRDLRVRFETEDGVVKAVDGVSFSVERGQTLGIVGESGSGKSVTSLAIMGLHGKARTEISGQILVGGRDVVAMPDPQVRGMRGKDVAMIFQDPLSALHPFYKVGKQIAGAYKVHHPAASKKETRQRVIEMLDRVGIPEPQKRFEQYPHEFSGGMRQRAMIAMALVNDPKLLIADEPTTALDVTVQAQILDLLNDLQEEFHSGIIMITHDLGVISQIAHEVLVMYAGRVVEQGSVGQIMKQAQHPYTWGLLESIPSLHGDPTVDLRPIKGNPPSLINVPSGCAFHPRCRYQMIDPGPCDIDIPQLLPVREAGHLVACHLPEQRRRSIYHDEVSEVGVAP